MALQKVLKAQVATPKWSKDLSPKKLREIHSLMVKARVLEERLIKMGKTGEGFFWIGGPGEEAYAIPLGLMIRKGRGIDYDFLHLHYRSSATLMAMGAKPSDTIRQMACVSTDPYSGGRNFVNHYCKPEWNIVPVSSCIEPQYTQSIGTAHAQRGNHSQGISVVNGGDAGTAEGDFATALVWSSRPASALPLLMIVANNEWGISTSFEGQHGEKRISDRGKAFQVMSATANGNDLWEAWDALTKAFYYVRRERRPYLLELKVSRLYGHSSASGANRTNDPCPIEKFEKALAKQKILSSQEAKKVWEGWTKEIGEDWRKVRQEPDPQPKSIFDHVYADVDGDKGRDMLAESVGVDFTKLTEAHWKDKRRN